MVDLIKGNEVSSSKLLEEASLSFLLTLEHVALNRFVWGTLEQAGTLRRYFPINHGVLYYTGYVVPPPLLVHRVDRSRTAGSNRWQSDWGEGCRRGIRSRRSFAACKVQAIA